MSSAFLKMTGFYLHTRGDGKRLQMSESSYSDIDFGKTVCSTLAETLLLNLQDDP